MASDTNEEVHFNKIYRFIVMLTVFGMVLSLATIFLPISKDNQRFADTAVIFWLSTAVSGGIGYLIGNSANTGKKKEDNANGTSIKDVDNITIEK